MNTNITTLSAILIQARFSSTRLPGKVLHPLCHETVLGMLIKNLTTLNIPIFVLTSDSESDEPVAKYCESHHISYFRGPLEDVALRFARFLALHPYEYFIRISADSPLMDASLVKTAIQISEQDSYDLITNVQKRTFPKGQSVEMVNTRLFLKVQAELMSTEHKEHVTKIFYEQPERFSIKNFESGGSFGDIQLSVDTTDDFRKIETMLHENQCRSAGWKRWIEIEKSLNHD
jgi:spore coat polysaccharide biosynthesis protein SpsF